MSHAVSVLCRRKGVSVRTQSNLSFQCEILAALHTAVMKLPGLDVGAFKRPGDLLFWRHLETSSALVLGQAPAAQRLIIFGAPLHELPCISQGLVDGGLESHHAYGKALRMGTTQVLGRLEVRKKTPLPCLKEKESLSSRDCHSSTISTLDTAPYRHLKNNDNYVEADLEAQWWALGPADEKVIQARRLACRLQGDMARTFLLVVVPGLLGTIPKLCTMNRAAYMLKRKPQLEDAHHKR